MTPTNSPLTRPGCSLPNMTPTELFGDISHAVSEFFNIKSSIFSCKNNICNICDP